MVRSLLLAMLAALMAISTTQAFAPMPIRTNTGVVSTSELNVSVKIDVGEGEPIESALRRFKREVNKSGHLMELRHRRHFENSQERKKRKIVQARIRKRFERMNRKRMSNRT
uniref:30S ribosomal protein S21 n=1 Tax=Eucampia antarctica TaxID=49252 RepID=A0A7S2RCI3_9STRA|mmetsp:Transcript_20403/g.19621  ORF Transcript_20403/g.19621 Transcript_20403/m.19621 type:complete len:112 (+) Transcript_20403:49-384(+)|eukprot:CAMPEP_0197831306 /NCGR_PEP_ID=MMETSP1437-20131217/9203_1 /TAXON_ID=49252 ORGANISM="Eucampia antarctica, Strain CCMP1452" /NCGR_SAMPLE_ID=MMETSP1437 /ASSEMBLY_ACC=CAM_ASM_001096 /LENGTH=111 /DNA_ID=CAMNT_0043434165 /DNA_START=45 /DNA_END=380 /DNA_ORIENTATION=+